MPRPIKKRIVDQPPLYTSFKPAGVRRIGLLQVALALDEYEALRLADYLHMDHEEAAVEMEISRPTFTRLLEKAREKLSSFIIEGKELRIGGGSIHFRENVMNCSDCGHMFKIEFSEEPARCPNCGSANLLDRAGGFGHGQCCRNRNKGQ
jgi:predicted DNA-binding protein (UPF0251 family)